MNPYGEQSGLFSIPCLSDDYGTTPAFPRVVANPNAVPVSFASTAWEDSLLGPTGVTQGLPVNARNGQVNRAIIRPVANMDLNQSLKGSNASTAEGFSVHQSLEGPPTFPQQFGGTGRSLPLV